jgi:hypothetical protein
MRESVYLIHYPEGDTQEAPGPLDYGVLVDVNGATLALPLPTKRMLAYRVWKISTEETRNEDIRHYYLEQVFPDELAGYVEG